jgi:hypothetical protein
MLGQAQQQVAHGKVGQNARIQKHAMIGVHSHSPV